MDKIESFEGQLLGYMPLKIQLSLLSSCYAKSLQSCPTLCDPIDGSPPGSPVPGILQARTLEWVASSFSNAWKWKEKVKSLSRVRLLATPWTAAYQAPLSMGFSRQEYWSGVPLPSPLEFMVLPYKVMGTHNRCFQIALHGILPDAANSWRWRGRSETFHHHYHYHLILTLQKMLLYLLRRPVN